MIFLTGTIIYHLFLLLMFLNTPLGFKMLYLSYTFRFANLSIYLLLLIIYLFSRQLFL